MADVIIEVFDETSNTTIPTLYHDNGDGTYSEVVSIAGGGGGGAASVPFAVLNFVPDGSNGSALAYGSTWNPIGPGGYLSAASSPGSKTYLTTQETDTGNNMLRGIANGWQVGHTAYWHSKFLFSAFNTAGSVKLSVGDDTTETGSTHNTNGSYGFYSDQALGKIYAFVYSGTTETKVDVTPAGGVGDTSSALFSAVYTPGTDVKFYINGTLVATINTNLPATTNTWLGKFGANAVTNASAEQRVTMFFMGININITA